MRTQRKVSEVSFHFDEVKKGDMIQLSQIILLAIGNESPIKMESVEIEVQVAKVETKAKQVAKVETKVETLVSKTLKERSKSDSGSERERADLISMQHVKKSIHAYDSRNSGIKQSLNTRSLANKSYSNNSGSNSKYNVSKFGEQKTSVHVQS